MPKTEQLEAQYHAANLDNLTRVIARLADDYNASTDSKRTWTGRALSFFGALLPIFAWPKSDEIISGRNMLELDDLIDFANESNVAMIFSGGSLREYLSSLPGVEVVDGLIKYRYAVLAKEHHGYIAMQERGEIQQQLKARSEN